MKPDTLITTLGRDPEGNFGVVNPPVYHASTILFPTLDALESAEKAFDPRRSRYGRYGTPTTFALEEAVAGLEGGGQAIVVSCGVAGITAALLAYVKAGDHVLVADTVYGPTRRIASTLLKRFGVTAEFYDPLIGGEIAGLIRPNTRAVFMESPGSLTFEIQDVPAIVAAARKAGITTVIDNTWATPLYFKPLSLGVDVVIQSATKYIGGHSDLMLGVLTANDAAYPALRRSVTDLGCCAGPDDCYLALRGLRTMGVRLARHEQTALALAHWLKARPEVDRVYHPAMPEDPGHELWRRDFTGSSGLFSFGLKATARAALAAMVDGLELFGMGFSWGGFESLLLPSNPAPLRTARPWQAPGPLLRVHAGLEDPEDLIADLDRAFARLNAAHV